MGRVETFRNATLYLGDCRDVMAAWPECFRVNSVITDPPYGVNLDGKLWFSTNRNKAVKSTETYASYEDTPENFAAVVLPAIDAALSRADCGAVFMADKTLPQLPAWAALGGIFSPAGTGLGSWGFQCFMHCAFYGRDPYLAAQMGSRPTGRYGMWGNDANKVAHPCAKPLDAMLWAVNRASLEDNTVLDPFMGSGTTGVAAAQLGRKFIGIEIEEKYFDVACRRIEEATRQKDLFIDKPDPIAETMPELLL